jgi:Protein of unknown function DUF262
MGLIDSIFRNFYIPPVIFAVEKDEDGKELRVCVDGKQRLTSISKFMDGIYDSINYTILLIFLLGQVCSFRCSHMSSTDFIPSI